MQLDVKLYEDIVWLTRQQVAGKCEVNGMMFDAVVKMIDRRTAVMVVNRESLLANEMNLRAVAYMIGDIVLPMCCMLCNVQKLQDILERSALCSGNPELTDKLARLVYDYLARCKGLG